MNLSNPLKKINNWIEDQVYLGWDPFDALNSPLLKLLTFGNRRIGQLWVQALKLSPVNPRPLLGVKKGLNPKGMGLFLQAFSQRFETSHQFEDKVLVEFFSEWLHENMSPGYQGACWGYNFDWPNRHFFAPAGTPTVVNTSFIGLAFLKAYRVACEISGDEKPSAEEIRAIYQEGNQTTIWCYERLQETIEKSFHYSKNGLAVARSACDFILHDLNQEKLDPGLTCFSYTPIDKRYIHNANMLAAWLLSEVSLLTGESELAEKALSAACYTVKYQHSQGSWWYGEAPKEHWIDNFHTGYVLVSLNHVAKNLAVGEFDEPITRGYEYWKSTFFREDGAPKYMPGKTYPIDIHSISQAILTFLEFSERDKDALNLALRTAEWAIKNMQSKQGYFYYQAHRFYKNKIPYMRWSQAWMFLALTSLEIALTKGDANGI